MNSCSPQVEVSTKESSLHFRYRHIPAVKNCHLGFEIRNTFFAKSIAALWRQRFFSGVQVYVTRVQDDKVWIEIEVVERPRLGNFKFVGVTKSEQEEILGKVNLTKQTIITENTTTPTTATTTIFFFFFNFCCLH